MLFACNVDGMEIRLRIDHYQSPSKHKFGDWWCDCGFSFKFKDIIDYRVAEDELLTPEEVIYWRNKLSDLLKDKIDSVTKFDFMEPDFEFILYPKRNLKDSGEYAYVAPGYEIEDIQAEWKVHLWFSGAPTGNCLTIPLYRKQITLLKQFLEDCINQDP